MKAPLPHTEAARVAALHEYRILDTLPEPAYHDLTRLASEICRTPIALVFGTLPTGKTPNEPFKEARSTFAGLRKTPRTWRPFWMRAG
jgi:hypothetical protein